MKCQILWSKGRKAILGVDLNVVVLETEFEERPGCAQVRAEAAVWQCTNSNSLLAMTLSSFGNAKQDCRGSASFLAACPHPLRQLRPALLDDESLRRLRQPLLYSPELAHRISTSRIRSRRLVLPGNLDLLEDGAHTARFPAQWVVSNRPSVFSLSPCAAHGVSSRNLCPLSSSLSFDQ